MHIAALYASILALMFVGLSVRTLRMRGRLRIAIGDGNLRFRVFGMAMTLATLVAASAYLIHSYVNGMLA